MVRVRSPAALRLATIRVRIASTAPSRPLGAPRAPAGLSGPRGADRIEGIGLALTAAVLPVGAIDLDDPDTSCGDITGQSGAVAAGPFDADQGNGTEPAQPAQQAGIAGRSGGELLNAEQPADRIERGGDMRIRVSIHAAGNCRATGNRACFFYVGRRRGDSRDAHHGACSGSPRLRSMLSCRNDRGPV
jgi:hypothetical protein